MNDKKIINDPVFGFIIIPKGPLLDIVKHPLFQRLSRIKQLGMSSAVYPGAQHTRFLHSLGAYHLMTEAIKELRNKGVFIFDSEAEAVKAAILMHDIGHAPFSHVLENTLIKGISHEDISIFMMEIINNEMNGILNLAISIFQNKYPKKFLHQLISSQLDMDRLDYLSRDSFFTGVVEGDVGSARIIKMLNVVDDKLVVEAKGIYSIENYLTSRRLMYWQVYLHKTAVSYEKNLVNLLLRAKDLASKGKEVFATPSLKYFLYNDVLADNFLNYQEGLEHYKLLDDNDIWSSVKAWTAHPDMILSTLANNLINHKTFKVEVHNERIPEETIKTIKHQLSDKYKISIEDTQYFMSINKIEKNMYDIEDDQINILFKDGKCQNIADVSELLDVTLLSKKNSKYYLCYQEF